MHEGGGEHDPAAVGLRDGLVAETHPEDRDLPGDATDQIDTDAGVLGTSGSRGDHDRVEPAGADPIRCDVVVVDDLHFGPDLPQVVGEVPRKRVVVVEQENAWGAQERTKNFTNTGSGSSGASRKSSNRRFSTPVFGIGK